MRRPSWKKLVLAVGGGGVLTGLVLVGAAYAVTSVPPPSAQTVQQATIIQYRDGSELGRVGALNRRLVPLSQVSDPAQKAILAAEDRGFYTEPGISPKGIARALFTNVRGGGDIQQGGSTITQQYAKNAFLTSERTYTRKVKEVLIALKMTQERSKDEILEDYLNTIYFGRGAYGIEAATETYFGGKAKDLSVAQAAVLASSIRSPAAYDPARHTERAKQRWAYVLDGMVEEGWLTQQERAAQEYPFVKAPGSTVQQDRSGPKGYVIDRVEDELAARGFSEARLAQGGLVVKTTLSRQAQEAAVEAVQAEVPKVDPVPDPDCLEDRPRQDCMDEAANALIQGALVAVKPGTGEVFAYYGGRTGNGGFDYASHDHPQDPGSTMKPFALAAALDKGISLRTRFNGNSPREFDGYPVPVRNFNDEDFGRIDLTTATANSVNTVYMALTEEIGPKAVEEMAHKAGIGDDVRLADENGDPALGITLGIYGVPVIDQANAFATFAAAGQAAEPFLVRSVREVGEDGPVYEAKVTTSEAFSADVAADATYAMQQVVERGSARRNGRLDGGRPAAGKTGTTQESNDAWMVGFTPQLSSAVWIGRGNNKPIVGELGSSGGLTGGSAPARIWKSFMDAALEGQPEEEFPPRAFVGSSRSVDGGADRDDDAPATRRPRRDRDEDRDEATPTQAPVEEQSEEPTQQPAPTRAPQTQPPQSPPPQEPGPQPSPEQPLPAPTQPAPQPTGDGQSRS